MKSNGAFHNHFKTTLAKLLKKNNITQKELAQLLNFTPQAISQYLSGKNVPDIHTLSKIAEILHVTMDELFTGKKPEYEVYRDNLGLSDKSIENLIRIREHKEYYNLLNFLFSDSDFFTAIATTYEQIKDTEKNYLAANGFINLSIENGENPKYDEIKDFIKDTVDLNEWRMSQILLRYFYQKIKSYGNVDTLEGILKKYLKKNQP